MTKKSTKRALISSVVSLLICFTMLLGTTFAWFTDSVVSGNNIITAGNLDMKVSYKPYGAEKTEWTEVKEDTVIFGKDAKYEPGYTEAVWLKIENAGSLAFKYAVSLNATEKEGVNKEGKTFKLSDYLNVKYANISDVATWEAFYETRESFDSFSFGDSHNSGETKFTNGAVSLINNGVALPSDGTTDTASYVLVIIEMPTTVGNEANHNGTDVPKIDFTLTAVATQVPNEEDSFDNQYDAGAEYPAVINHYVDANTTYDEFAEMIAEGGNIAVTEDVTITNPESSRFTEFKLDRNVGLYIEDGKTLTFGETTSISGDKTLTVYSGSISETQEFCVEDNAKLVINGGTHSFNALSATINGSITVNGGTVNCNGTYGGVLGVSLAENGKVVINDGTMNMYQPFNLNANRCDNAYVEINGGKINLLNDADKLFAVRNIMDKDRTSGVLRGSSIKITGGTFTTTYQMDDTGDANAFIRNEDGNCDTTRVLVSNTYNDEAQYNCVVTGGTFYGCWTRTGETGGDGTEVCENTIAGFVADGYSIAGDETNGYVVSKN